MYEQVIAHVEAIVMIVGIALYLTGFQIPGATIMLTDLILLIATLVIGGGDVNGV